MKKIIILPFLFLGLISWGQAQFIVQNGTKTEVYSNINTAIENAVSGDTLYIPGGGFALTNTTIGKTLHWVGHGHYPAATSATLPSRITSNLVFNGNCDNSSFEGIWFTGNISFGDAAGNEDTNIKIKRCRISGNCTLRSTDANNPNLNFVISECIINGDLNAKNGSNCQVEKTLLFNNISYFYQSQFLNIIHMPGEEGYYDAETIKSCNSCTFRNSIFTTYSGTENTNSSTFKNNVFTRSTLNGDIEHPGTGNTETNSLYEIPLANLFTSLTTNVWTFSYDNDYHLVSGSPGKDYGDNSFDVGIYGSATPYKTIPYYPHINTANIADNAVNDQLGVTINAEAQDR